MNQRTIISITIATILVITNGLIGHFLPPNGIMLTPVVLIATTSLVCFGTKNLNVIFMSILTYAFIALNDILIKLYSGGTHDSEGSTWILLFLFIGLIPSFIILLIAILTRVDEKPSTKLFGIGFFIALGCLHFQAFGDLGL